ncbi:winged helix-turn-helix transcriptional regulator [Sphingobacterium faecale]|uniref:Helix-turn-helix transcriptional regulator n=1 Tax=Sphingobacterium faecale TaxID=2803775 RepID=A0ABS1R5T3_9SPHI|nr:helix-turn-helix domain-containing protein [Sphingobacterium faecale]MBL1409919.1 helix-turn-helix transcriptional regulator [Sphingobacterium faecale]
MYINKIPQTLDYGVSVTMKVIGGKWKPCIIDSIANGVNRPAHIHKAIKQVSLRVINQQLSELMDFEIIEKEVFDGYPLHVEYKLTTFGKTLLTVIEAMESWGDTYAEKVTQLAINRNENIIL